MSDIDIYKLPEGLLRRIVDYGYLGEWGTGKWLNLNINKMLDILGEHNMNYSQYMSGIRFMDKSRLSSEVEPSKLSIMRMNALINKYNKHIKDIDFQCYSNMDVGEFIKNTYKSCSDKLMSLDGLLRLFFDIIITYKINQMNTRHTLNLFSIGVKPVYYESILSEIYTALIDTIHSGNKTDVDIERITAFYLAFKRLVCSNSEMVGIIDTLFSRYLSLHGFKSITISLLMHNTSNIEFRDDEEDYVIKECAKYITHNDKVDRYEGEYYTESVYEYDSYRIKGVTLYCKEDTNINEDEVIFNLRLIQDEFTESELTISQDKLRLLSESGEIIPFISENQNVMRSCILYEYESDIYLIYNSFGNICGQSLLNDSTIDLL